MKNQRGITYIALLIAISLFGATLALAGSLWSTDAKRERELQLLFVGDQFRKAIASYHDEAPAGQPNRFPARLEDLVLDRRWPTTRRHLRKIYLDPMTGTREWTLIRAPDNTIMGINSASEAEPIKHAGFSDDYKNFESAKTYREWQFVFSQQQQKGARPVGRAPGLLDGLPKMPGSSTPAQGAPDDTDQ